MGGLQIEKGGMLRRGLLYRADNQANATDAGRQVLVTPLAIIYAYAANITQDLSHEYGREATLYTARHSIMLYCRYW